MDQPLVSIMIPTYNQSKWLSAAVDSALKQDYPNVEIIISDDHSSDDTREILKKYATQSRVKVFTNQNNLGRVANYKYTLEKYASGDWVVNLDGDDYFTDSSFISFAMNQIRNVNNVVFIQGGHSITDAEGNVLQIALPAIENDYETIDGTDYFLNFHHFSHLGSIYNRKAAIETGFYTHDILSSDIECFLRLALHGKVILMRRIVGAWVHHTANESKRLSINAVEENMMRFTGPYNYARQKGKIPENILKRWLTKKTNEYLLNYLTIYFTDNKRIPGYANHVFKKYPHVKSSIILPKAFLKGLKNKISNRFVTKN